MFYFNVLNPKLIHVFCNICFFFYFNLSITINTFYLESFVTNLPWKYDRTDPTTKFYITPVLRLRPPGDYFTETHKFISQYCKLKRLRMFLIVRQNCHTIRTVAEFLMTIFQNLSTCTNIDFFPISGLPLLDLL